MNATMPTEKCHCWILEPGKTVEKNGKSWPAGHFCNQTATRYQRIGSVVEAVCLDCYERDIAKGAIPSTQQAYRDFIESDD